MQQRYYRRQLHSAVFHGQFTSHSHGVLPMPLIQRQQLDEVTVVAGLFAIVFPNHLEGLRQCPMFEGCTVTQGAGAVLEQRQVVPDTKPSLVLVKAACMFRDHLFAI